MPVRRRPGAGLAIFLVMLAGFSGGSWAVEPDAARPLRAALRELQDAGLSLVFSNALVSSDLQVTRPVDPDQDLVDQAVALLAPFGLGLQRTGSGLWYVVRDGGVLREAVPDRARPPAQPSEPLIEEIVVSSSRYRLVRDVHPRRSLDQRELEVTPSIGRDLLRSVNQLPGQASMGVSARSHMRGGDSNEVLYLLDGVQIIEPFHMGDFHALFSTVNPALVESIDVYHAGFPAAYGSRLSGVVDMALTEPQRPLQGRLNVDFINVAAQAQGFRGDLQWLVSARRSTVDQLIGLLENDYGEPAFHDELIRLAWRGDATEVAAGLLYGNDELSLQDDGAGEMARADYHNLATWVRVNRDLGERATAEVSGSFTRVENQRAGRLDDPTDAVGALAEERQFDVATLHANLRWRTSESWSWHAGVEAQQQQGEFDVAIDTRYGPLGLPLQPAPLLRRDVSAERDGTLITAFLSARYELGDALSVELGGRYDMQDIDPVHDDQFSPRLHVAYRSPDGWRAFLDAGRYAQHQNLYELQLDDGLLELNEPQLADQISVGADWTLSERWRLRAEAYWRKIDDPWRRFENLYNRWVLLPELHADRVSVSAERARTFGTELAMEYAPAETLRASLSVAVARAEERLAGRWRPRPWEQASTVRAGLAWRPGRWRVGAAATYHDGWPTTSLLTAVPSGPPASPDRYFDAELPSFFSLDVHVARRFDLPASVLEIYFDLANATMADQIGGYRYVPSDGVLVPERRKLLPGIPVLGLSWAW